LFYVAEGLFYVAEGLFYTAEGLFYTAEEAFRKGCMNSSFRGEKRERRILLPEARYGLPRAFWRLFKGLPLPGKSKTVYPVATGRMAAAGEVKPEPLPRERTIPGKPLPVTKFSLKREVSQN
jgi:hypothetical protein